MERVERFSESRGCDNRGESVFSAEYDLRDGCRGNGRSPAVLGIGVVAGKGVLEPAVSSLHPASAQNRGYLCIVHRVRGNRGELSDRSGARVPAVIGESSGRGADVGAEEV